MKFFHYVTHFFLRLFENKRNGREKQIFADQSKERSIEADLFLTGFSTKNFFEQGFLALRPVSVHFMSHFGGGMRGNDYLVEQKSFRRDRMNGFEQ